jgi:hypothetical protein
MPNNKRDDTRNHNETKEESVSTGTSLTPEQSKATAMVVADEKGIAACKKKYGSADPDFLRGLAMRVTRSDRTLSEQERDYKLAVIRGAEPRSPLETMLALQMVAIHDALMRSQDNFVHAENVMQQDSAGRMLPKLARTFLDQLMPWSATGPVAIRK